ncbi:MAG: DUF4167 domain-containing protein [Parvularcula sp.]
MAQNSKRGRHNNRRRQNPNNINRSLDSNGPEVKIRGTASQIYEKYQALARDATSAGDRIRGESLLQHAEHYYRLMRAMQLEQEKREEQKAERAAEQQRNAEQRQSERSAESEPVGAVAEATGEDGAPAVAETQGGEEAKAGDAEDAPKARRTRRRRPARKPADETEAPSAEGDSSPEPSVPAE